MTHRHLAIEVREAGIYWVRSVCRRRGLVPDAHGSARRRPEASPQAEVARLLGERWTRACHLELSHNAATLAREPLPLVSYRDALRVAGRRAEERLQRPLDSDCLGVARRRGSHDDPVWICAADPVEVQEELARWNDHDVRIQRLQSRAFALGNVARALTGLGEGDIVALLDLEVDTGTCVVADRHGWLFSREMPLRFMGDRRIRSVVRRDPAEEPPSGLFLVGESDKEEDGDGDPYHELSELINRLTTELRRTFTYVGGELRIGNVGRVVVSGELPDLDDVARSLAANLDLPVTLFGNALAGTPLAGVPNGAVTAVGMAHAPDCDGGNLLPHDVLRTRSELVARRRITRALVASVLAAGVATFVGGTLLERLQSQLTDLEARWVASAGEREALESLQKAHRHREELEAAFARIDRPGPSWTALLAALGRLAPDRAYLQSFSASLGESGWTYAFSVESEGVTVSDAARPVSKLADALGASPLVAVTSAKREEAGRPSDPQGDLGRVRFRIEGVLAEIVDAPPSGGDDG